MWCNERGFFIARNKWAWIIASDWLGFLVVFHVYFSLSPNETSSLEYYRNLFLIQNYDVLFSDRGANWLTRQLNFHNHNRQVITLSTRPQLPPHDKPPRHYKFIHHLYAVLLNRTAQLLPFIQYPFTRLKGCNSSKHWTTEPNLHNNIV